MTMTSHSTHSNSFSVMKFYGSKSKWKQKERTITNSLEKLYKVPKAFPHRIQGPAMIWKTFFRLKDAINFTSKFNKDVSVFAFESSTGDQIGGKRRYLVTSLPVFWHYYSQLEPSQRHHYEIIPEGCPCKLYFDLEYMKDVNKDKDGDCMVDILIQYVCLWLKATYNIDCDRADVLDLDASTSKKCSHHLIFQLNQAFENCITAGQFIRFIFQLLVKYVKLSSSTCAKVEKKGVRVDTSCHQELFNPEDNEELIHLTECCEEIDQRESRFSGLTEIGDRTLQQCGPCLNTVNHPQVVTNVHLKDKKVTAVWPRYGNLGEFTSEQLALLRSFSLDALSSLLVKNKDGNETLFCDLGVYNKNRNFRLFLSSKLHQFNPLLPSSTNKYLPGRAQKGFNQSNEEFLFYASLISVLHNDSSTEPLRVNDIMKLTSGPLATRFKSSAAKTVEDTLEGNMCSSPYPLIDNFIQSLINSPEHSGSIYRWAYFKSNHSMIYSITGFRWCSNIQRHHRRNNIMYVVDLQLGMYYQKCYDPDCQGYKSDSRDIPYHVLPETFFEDESMRAAGDCMEYDCMDDDSDDDMLVAAADKLGT